MAWSVRSVWQLGPASSWRFGLTDGRRGNVLITRGQGEEDLASKVTVLYAKKVLGNGIRLDIRWGNGFLARGASQKVELMNNVNGRNCGNEHARLGKAVKNKLCAFCATRITEFNRTKEHLLPKGLTGTRSYDFIACEECNNNKSALDDVISPNVAEISGRSRYEVGRDGRHCWYC